MEIGDKVEVIKLVDCDEQDTNLEIGNNGIITGMERNILGFPTYNVDFGELFVGHGVNFNDDGTYQMYQEQLKLINN